MPAILRNSPNFPSIPMCTAKVPTESHQYHDTDSVPGSETIALTMWFWERIILLLGCAHVPSPYSLRRPQSVFLSRE
jgi:hypothetical protein